jgi:4-hydroxybenzoate polyprenyltransferase
VKSGTAKAKFAVRSFTALRPFSGPATRSWRARLGKVRAASELVGLDLVLGAGIFVVAGEVLSLGHLPHPGIALLGFMTGFFVSGSANISNDYFDRDVDSVNRPDRPLPSG